MKRFLTVGLLFVGCTLAARAPRREALIFSPCDVNQDGRTNVADIQYEINEILGFLPATPSGDVNRDGLINVADLQLVVNAALGLGCAQ